MSEKRKEYIKTAAACFVAAALIWGTLLAPLAIKVTHAHTYPSSTENGKSNKIPLSSKNDSAKTQTDEATKNQTGSAQGKSSIDAATVIAILAVVAYFIQAFLMRSTLIHTNRAYVHVGLWDKTANFDGEGNIVSWKFNPRFENVGNTPTWSMEYCSCFVICNQELPAGHRFADVVPIYRSVIGPKQYMYGPDTTVSLPTLNRELWVYICGWISYGDVFYFTKRHRTEFCYRIFAYGDPANKECNFGYFLHSDFNNVDGECDRAKRKREKLPVPEGVNKIRQTKYGDPTPGKELFETSSVDHIPPPPP